MNNQEQEQTITTAVSNTNTLFAEKISKDVAEAEITSWLNRKKVMPWKREKYKDHIETLTEALRYGTLSIKEATGMIVQSLLFPIKNTDGEEVLSELKYEPRLRVEAINNELKSVKFDDSPGLTTAHIVALTGQPKSIISKLDTEDNSIARAIAIFFM